MQISQPRGRKSRPTRASRTLDLPLLWLPTTATCGSDISLPTATGARMSCSLFIIGISDEPIVTEPLATQSTASPIDPFALFFCFEFEEEKLREFIPTVATAWRSSKHFDWKWVYLVFISGPSKDRLRLFGPGHSGVVRLLRVLIHTRILILT